LHAQIPPKAQQDINDLTLFFALLGYMHVKVASKDVGEINLCFLSDFIAKCLQTIKKLGQSNVCRESG